MLKPKVQRPQQPEPAPAPQPAPAVQLSFSFSVDHKLKSKLPLLGIVALLFLLALVMFARANLSFSDLFEFGRLALSVEKLYSISLVLFVILFAAAIALAAVFGEGIHSGQAMLAFGVLFVPFLLASIFFSKYLLAFIPFTIACGLVAVFATSMEKKNFSSYWNVVGRALFVLAILAVLFTIIKVNGNKDAYFDAFLSGALEFAPLVAGQVTGSPAAGGSDVDTAALENLLYAAIKNLQEQQDSGEGNSLITKELVASLVSQAYDPFRTRIIESGNWKSKPEKDYALQQMPSWSGLGQANQTLLVDAVYEKWKTVSLLPSGSGGESGEDAARALAKSLAQSIKAQMTPKDGSNSQPTQLFNLDVKTARNILLKVDFVRTFYNYFEFFIGLLVFSFISAMNFVVRILATLIAYGIGKL